jgi:hypothetical protein
MNSSRRAPARGNILFGHAEAVECTVKDLSAVGASIELQGQRNVPDTFTLKLASTAIPHLCRVVSRVDGNIGVIFT